MRWTQTTRDGQRDIFTVLWYSDVSGRPDTVEAISRDYKRGDNGDRRRAVRWANRAMDLYIAKKEDLERMN